MILANTPLRLLLSLAAFVSLVIAGDRLGGWMLHKTVLSTKFRYSQMYRGELGGETVLLGNSRGVHMLHPPAVEQVTGEKTVNISFNALPPLLMPAIWQDYLQRHPAPKHLLFEISCLHREDEPGAFQRFTTYMASSQSLRQTLSHARPKVYRFANVSHLYRYNNELPIRSLFFFRNDDQDWILPDVATPEQIERALGFEVEEILFSQANIDSARQVCQSAEAVGTKVTLMIGPYHPRYLRELEELPRWIEWAEAQLGRDVHDLSAVITDPKAFGDPIHLNNDGAQMLVDEMVRRGLIQSDQSGSWSVEGHRSNADD